MVDITEPSVKTSYTFSPTYYDGITASLPVFYAQRICPVIFASPRIFAKMSRRSEKITDRGERVAIEVGRDRRRNKTKGRKGRCCATLAVVSLQERRLSYVANARSESKINESCLPRNRRVEMRTRSNVSAHAHVGELSLGSARREAHYAT